MGSALVPIMAKMTGGNKYMEMNKDQGKVNKNIDKDVFIIGSAWGRTGTSSTQKALQILGYPCYHNREILNNLDFHFFIKAGKEKMKMKQQNIDNGDLQTPWKDTVITNFDWNKVFKDRGYHACLDEPICSFYKELMGYYPKYKVIHNVRDADKWYNSASKTTLKFNTVMKARWIYRLLFGGLADYYWSCFGDYILDGKLLCDEEFVKKRYDDWTEEVINYVPKDRLLLFDLKKGWEPLCKFLEIDDIPDVPFPHSNERTVLTDAIRNAEIVANLVDISFVFTTIGLIYCYRDSKVMVNVKNVVIENTMKIKALVM